MKITKAQMNALRFRNQLKRIMEPNALFKEPKNKELNLGKSLASKIAKSNKRFDVYKKGFI